jgi:hypothetical protein
MKKTLLVAQLSMLMVLLALDSVYAQSSNPGNNPPPQRGWYCPNCGSYQGGGYGMGPGMMGGRGYGYGMGPGMMGGQGYGYGTGPGMMGGQGYGPNQQYPYAQQQPQKPIDKDQAKSMVENYLKSTGNPNLKLGDIKDGGQNFQADVVTKDNSLADKILIDKNTGWMRPAY